MFAIICCTIALVVALIWATIEIIEIDKDYKRRKAALDAWYESELERIRLSYQEVNEKHVAWYDYDSDEEEK